MLSLRTQLNAAATESDLYAFVMRSYRMFEQAVYGTAYSRSDSTACGEGLTDVERDHEGLQVNPRLLGPSDEVLGAMIVQIKTHQCQFECLEEAADRSEPIISRGVGAIRQAQLVLCSLPGPKEKGVLRKLLQSVPRVDRVPVVHFPVFMLCRLARSLGRKYLVSV